MMYYDNKAIKLRKLIYYLAFVVLASNQLCDGRQIDGRDVPERYPYHANIKQDRIYREFVLNEQEPLTRFICPRNYFIETVITSYLHFGGNHLNLETEILTKPFTRKVAYDTGNIQVESPHLTTTKDADVNNRNIDEAPEDADFLREHADVNNRNIDEAPEGVDFLREHSDADTAVNHCPTLKMCLGYAGCVFKFGIEFCKQDILPGNRKQLHGNISCLHTRVLENVGHGATQQQTSHTQYGDVELHFLKLDDLRIRNNQVTYLKYTSQAEFVKPDHMNTVIEEVNTEVEEIFEAKCDVDDGYVGECNENEGVDDMSYNYWDVLTRAGSTECREELTQVYCAYKFNKMGKCWPKYAVHRDAVNSTDRFIAPSYEIFPPLYEPSDREEKFTKNEELPNRNGVHHSLHPARLAFLITMHRSPGAVVDIIERLYNPMNTFMIHVDKRKPDVRNRLDSMLQTRFPNSSNVRILPASQSFAGAWASYRVERSMMEGLRALLEEPNWEFVIKMSGSDLPLRSSEDWGFLLAKYRGRSIVDYISINNSLPQYSWHECGAYVYKVPIEISPPEDLIRYQGSMWSVPHRSLVRLMFSRDRLPHVRSSLFFQATSCLPDESFTQTVLLNSPLANSSINTRLTWLKTFEGKNSLHLCRHINDADFCGRGPALITPEDLPTIYEESHKHFLARKFDTDSVNNSIRKAIREYSSIGYYGEMNILLNERVFHHLLRSFVKKIIQNNELLQVNDLNADEILASAEKNGINYKYRLLPELDLQDPCCALPHSNGYRSSQTYSTVVDYILETDQKIIKIRGRANISPPFSCLNDGQLRAIRYTTYTSFGIGNTSPLSSNLPIPYSKAPVRDVFVDLLILPNDFGVNEECRQKSKLTGLPLQFFNLNVNNVSATPIELDVGVEDSNGILRGHVKAMIEWNNKTVGPIQGKGENVQLGHIVKIHCPKPLFEGKYTIVIQQDIKGSRRYRMPLTVVNTEDGKHQDRSCPNCGVLDADMKGAKDGDQLFDGLYDVEDVTIVQAKQNTRSSGSNKFTRWIDDL